LDRFGPVLALGAQVIASSPIALEEAPLSSTAEAVTPASVLEQRKIALIQAHLDGVWSFLRRLGLSPADAEDAGQEVFITAVKKLDQIFPGQEKRFLFAVAVRVASHRHRSRRSFMRRAVEVDVDTFEAVSPSSEAILERREALVLLDRALATLPEEMRTVLVLYELEEMTMPEIAAVLDIPIGTVSSRLRRAREQFQKATRRLQARGT
jgi:RNA polymerase sigma-70 factor (ECF subfamily)